MKLTKKQIFSFQKKIFNWWKENKRDLPWRNTHDPYKIMVSEVMLQQTQVSRVLARYAEFIEAYPTVQSLAKASTADVLKTWKGMGYNRRALYLKKTAQSICDTYGGQFPMNYEQLTNLPGLGTYTARAILVFAYKQDIACVDTNIRRIIAHFFFAKAQGPALEVQVEKVARQLLPKGKSWEWHQALMDFGAIELSKLNRTKRRDVPNGTSQSRKTQIPFRDSNRFYRGRIIDRLREGNMRESFIIKECQTKYGKSREFIITIIAGLAHDGLLARFTHGTIGLPRG